MRAVAFAIAILSMSGPILGDQNSLGECEHEIVYLPQTHINVVGDKTPTIKDLEETAKSQYGIAKFIAAHSQIPIFSEQVGATFSTRGVQNFSTSPRAQEFRSLFPQGLPKTYESLTADQKKKIAISGGEAVMLMLGQIDTVYGTTESNEVQDQYINSVADWFRNHPEVKSVVPGSEIYRKIFDERELLTLTKISSYFSSHPEQKKVVLIFGRLHDFTRHPSVFPSQCIAIPPNFN